MDTTTILHPDAAEALDVLGPTVAILTPPPDKEPSYCVIRGAIPPGVSVPLHSHPDEESFYLLSGAVDVLIQRGTKLDWRAVTPGDFVHVPKNVKHAWRSTGSGPAISLIVTTSTLGRYFAEIGIPVVPGAAPPPPSSEIIDRFVRTSTRYGHWLGTPEENAAVGIVLPPG